jgi:hypothetical protein
MVSQCISQDKRCQDSHTQNSNAFESKIMKTLTTLLFTLLCWTGFALAKLPALSPEAQEAANLAAAKTAYTAKVDAYALCRAQDRVVQSVASHHKTGKPMSTPACADPGPFVPPSAATQTSTSSAPGVSNPSVASPVAKK